MFFIQFHCSFNTSMACTIPARLRSNYASAAGISHGAVSSRYAPLRRNIYRRRPHADGRMHSRLVALFIHEIARPTKTATRHSESHSANLDLPSQ